MEVIKQHAGAYGAGAEYAHTVLHNQVPSLS